jgi:hypothetical protein
VPNKPKVTADQRGALTFLARAGRRGAIEALMRARGFTANILAHLVLVGFATAQPEINNAGGRRIEVIRMRITDAGRDALAAEG